MNYRRKQISIFLLVGMLLLSIVGNLFSGKAYAGGWIQKSSDPTGKGRHWTSYSVINQQ